MGCSVAYCIPALRIELIISDLITATAGLML